MCCSYVFTLKNKQTVPCKPPDRQLVHVHKEIYIAIVG